MRPRHLEIEGFASFRDRTQVDFDQVELFVLTGPTGAGKSTIIDAVTFALYGSVPRYDDRRLVAPVISQGKLEAKVRLDFEVAGEGYTAVRVVRRTKAGATTKEARLETAAGRTLAGSATELEREIERLVGLSFEHFTKCVVLPQGDFAEFLHARPADRQDMLVHLLNLELYRRVQRAANQRAKVAEDRAAYLTRRLQEELAGATPEAVEAGAKKVATLEGVLHQIDERRRELDALALEAKDFAAEAGSIAQSISLLQALETVPEGVAELARNLDDTGRGLESAETEKRAAEEERSGAEEARAELPEAASLQAATTLHERRVQLETDMKAAEVRLRQATDAESESRRLAEASARAFEAAAKALEALEREHAAFHLALGLEAGASCPVCLQEVAAPPDHPTPTGLDSAKAALDRARVERDARQGEHNGKVTDLATARTHLEGKRSDLAGVMSALSEHPSAKALEQLRSRVAEADERLTRARARDAAASSALAEARRSLEEMEASKQAAWRRYSEARDPVASLGPPPPDHQRLADSWNALADWARQTIGAQRKAREAAQAQAEQAARHRTEVLEALASTASEAGVVVGDGDVRDATSGALHEARADMRRLTDRLEEANRAREERETAAAEMTVARELGRLLGANRFERWLMNKALARLVEGATVILRDLSEGAYSLDLAEDNTFRVVDHRNADELRSAKTLSGGETFLASLALALSLADDVAQLSAQGAARLDALFLDEGFGTLDAETLDTVATAIEELGARGRMVGLVTHVRELADRIPVRYEVRKVGGSSTVRREVT